MKALDWLFDLVHFMTVLMVIFVIMFGGSAIIKVIKFVFGKPPSHVCTKDHPWDKETLPVTHVDAYFIGDSHTLLCPNCHHCWSLGPDV